MKHILLIATGGTIASLPSSSGLAPALTSEELLARVPDIAEVCRVSTVQPYLLDSTNMCYRQWLPIAALIEEHYDDYDGFVITHGTDTLSYAAATFSYLIQKNRKPIVLTGAQKSIYDEDTDGRRNLYQAFAYAADPRACGTHVVFDGHVIAGTRARKTHTRSFHAFSSIDFPDVAVFRGGRLIFFVDESAEYGAPLFYHRLCPQVVSLRLIPGMGADVLRAIGTHCRGLVIESFGIGGIPYDDDDSISAEIARLLSEGVRIVVTTQVPHEGSDLSVYRVGRIVKEHFHLPEASDMTTEAIVAKMMWALAETDTPDDFERLFCTPVGRDRL